jgi:hypothetical protein
MKNNLLLSLMLIGFFACQTTAPTSDAWTAFKICATNNCVKEAIAVKDDFLKNPQKVLTDFQATYEKGEDHVIGWLYILRDSVLTNPNMGALDARMKMRDAIVAAAKPFENDPKVHEMAKSVVSEMSSTSIISETEDDDAHDMAETTSTFCYQFDHQGEHIKCQLFSAANGEFTGYYTWYIEGKDGMHGVLKGKNFFNDTLLADYTYIQEGYTHTEEIVLLKKGDNLTRLEGEMYEKGGKMVIRDKKKLKASNTLVKADCAKLTKDFKHIRDMEKDMVFQYPDPELSEKDVKVVEKLQGEWQSKEDPKAGIKIENGRFSYVYAGQKPDPSMRYIYYPTCPKDCNPVAKMPCLKIIGQDDVCYSIVKADGKVLDISQIGGKGNTNQYVKKK